MSPTAQPRSTRITRQAVADGLRQQIVQGQYLPGARLPSREALVKTTGASYVTVQCGLTQLGEEGFVVSRHGDGTYVAAYPPHLHHYGLLLSRAETFVRTPGRARFHRALLEAAERFNALQSERRIVLWFDPREEPARPALAEAVERARLRRLAGMMLIDAPAPHLLASPLLNDPHLPVVTASPQRADTAGLTHVSPHLTSFLKQALAHLAHAGRQRVAMLTTEDMHLPLQAALAKLASSFGLVTKPYWTIPLQPRLTDGIRATVRLLYDRQPAERPDGLILADDHMIECAMDGLYESGVNTRRDVTVVGYCNFPDRPASKLPIVRIGTDCRDLLARMIETIDQLVRRQKVPAQRWIEPITETQFEQQNPPQ